jgi:hypothetical protein
MSASVACVGRKTRLPRASARNAERRFKRWRGARCGGES